VTHGFENQRITMKAKLNRLSRRYATALRKHLKQGLRASLQPAQRLGHQAVVIGLETLDIARIHEQALAELLSARISSTIRKRIVKRAKGFFIEAITPIEKTHRLAREASVHLNHLTKTLGRRTMDLTATNRDLKKEIVQRKSAQQSLKKSGEHHAKLLKRSRHLQRYLRRLTHRILLAQEDKRTKISRELHDEIAQTLLGINVRLLALKQGATVNAKGLKKEIANTQRLVEKSETTMRRFGRVFGNHHEE
jgi:signal transduction histidine kinase